MHQSVVVDVAAVVVEYQAVGALLFFLTVQFQFVQMACQHTDLVPEVVQLPASLESPRRTGHVWSRRSLRERRWDPWLLCLEVMEACLIWPVLQAALDLRLWYSATNEVVLEHNI